MIEVKNLSKRYGKSYALKDISFRIKEGEIVGFLGPNGAGKSTTMNIITGYISSSNGSVSVAGFDILEEPNEVKSRIGYLPEQPPLYIDMTVAEYLGFMYDLKKVKLPKKAHIHEICGLVKIQDVYGRLIRNLSKGYRQRVGIAQALLGNPSVLILDEPTVGLDPKQIIEIRNLISHLGKSHTVILSSHILSEIQVTCERIIIIQKGQIVADGTPDEIAAKVSTEHKLIVRIEGPKDQVQKTLEELPFVVDLTVYGEREAGVFEYAVEAEDGQDIRKRLFAVLAEKDWPIMGLKTSDITLEDIFIQLTNEGELAESDDDDDQGRAETASKGLPAENRGTGQGTASGTTEDSRGQDTVKEEGKQ